MVMWPKIVGFYVENRWNFDQPNEEQQALLESNLRAIIWYLYNNEAVLLGPSFLFIIGMFYGKKTHLDC
jgi:hypothetical protein